MESVARMVTWPRTSTYMEWPNSPWRMSVSPSRWRRTCDCSASTLSASCSTLARNGSEPSSVGRSGAGAEEMLCKGSTGLASYHSFCDVRDARARVARGRDGSRVAYLSRVVMLRRPELEIEVDGLLSGEPGTLGV